MHNVFVNTVPAWLSHKTLNIQLAPPCWPDSEPTVKDSDESDHQNFANLGLNIAKLHLATQQAQVKQRQEV